MMLKHKSLFLNFLVMMLMLCKVLFLNSGKKSVRQTRIPTLFFDIALERGAFYMTTIPENFASFVYVWRGSGK